MEWIAALATLMTAIFTGLLWRVSRQQAEILIKQATIQEALAKSELEGLLFLEFEPRSPVPTTTWTGKLYAVNLGKHGCIIWEVAVLSPVGELKRGNEVESVPIVKSVPVLPGERKEIKQVPSIRSLCPKQEWWPHFEATQEIPLEVIYTHGGEPEGVFHDLFKVKLTKTRWGTQEMFEVETVVLVDRQPYRA